MMSRGIAETVIPSVLKISDVSSSEEVCLLTDKSGLLMADICSCQDCGEASVKLVSSVPDFNKLSPGVKNSKNIEKNITDDFSVKAFPQTLQIPQMPQSQHQSSRLAPPVSPKARTRSEASADSSRKSSLPLLSPASPSRKYFKKIPSPVLSAGNRRGSEPALMSSLQQAQLNVTDRRWEKLRAILVAMKNKPFDVDTCLKASSSELLNSLQDKINANNEKIAIQGELLYLQDALKQKELELQQAEAERDSALAYIRHLKANLSDAGEQTMQLYKQGLESLKASSVSKENVIDIVTSLVKELDEQKSYLDCLMTVVLMRAPWMLDEVDRMELPKNQELVNPGDDFDEEHDFQFEDSDNEVWC
ncbi:hypothetical protein BsWGS_21278 [Bradybaena similaris]